MEEYIEPTPIEDGEDLSVHSAPKSEKYVLGSAMMDSDCLLELTNRLTSDCFFDPRHKSIMKAITSLNDKSAEVSPASVIEELSRLKLLNTIGGLEYIYEICNSFPSFSENSAYIDIVEEHYLLRSLHKVCSEINGRILSGKESFVQLSDDAAKKVSALAERRKTGDIAPVKNYTEEVLKMAEGKDLNDRNLLGVDTGFATLNSYTKGFKKGEMIVLGARPGIGKSALAMNMATNACLNMDAKIAYFSLEMSNEQLTGRIISSFSGVPYGKIQEGNVTAEEMRRIEAAQIEVNKLHLFLDVETDNKLSEITAKCLKLARQGQLDLVVIDYLQLITDSNTKSGNRQEEVARISRGLKKMARQLNVPVLALSQLSREIDKSENRTEPTLADIRESGSIEQDADIVLLLYRKNQQPAEGETPKGPTNYKVYLSVAKNRQGKQGKIELYFKGSQFKFTELDENADLGTDN